MKTLVLPFILPLALIASCSLQEADGPETIAENTLPASITGEEGTLVFDDEGLVSITPLAGKPGVADVTFRSIKVIRPWTVTAVGPEGEGESYQLVVRIDGVAYSLTEDGSLSFGSGEKTAAVTFFHQCNDLLFVSLMDAPSKVTVSGSLKQDGEGELQPGQKLGGNLKVRISMENEQNLLLNYNSLTVKNYSHSIFGSF